MSQFFQRLKNPALNTLEHAIVRGADAGTSILLVMILAPEAFSKLALAQAVMAPILLFFISPELVIYREYTIWKKSGPTALASRIKVFRHFGYMKGIFAIFCAFGIAWLGSRTGVSDSAGFGTRLWASIWAFGWVLAPQISSIDREFLRLELRLRELNLLSLYQKLSMLVGTGGVLFGLQSGAVLPALAGVSVFSCVSSAVLARSWVVSSFERQGIRAVSADSLRFVLISIKEFSLWRHLSGTLQDWILTMDLFFLGVFHFPAREVGLYAAVLKISNFSLAVPIALANYFLVSLSRGAKPEERSGISEAERKRVWKMSGAMVLLLVVQTAFILLLSPWLVELLSRGRWTPLEQLQMISWLHWILPGAALFASVFTLVWWMLLKASPRAFLLKIFAPWGVLSLLTYSIWIRWQGIQGAAMANMLVAACWILLAGAYYWTEIRGIADSPTGVVGPERN